MKLIIINILLVLMYYQVQTQNCVPEPPCSICDNSPTSCVACREKFFLLGNECIPCTFPCYQCESTQICSDCDNENSGYYLNIFECLPCVYPCLTCYQPDYCNSCGWDVENRIEDRFCKCKENLYEYVEQKKCVKCTNPCIACSSPTFCFDCDNYNSGMYSNQGDCIPCKYPCLTCASETFCYSCGYDVDKRIQDHTCKCLDGWQDDGSECRPCTYPCTKCTSEDYCLYCGSETSGFWANSEGICKLCYYPCTNCIGPRNCLSCGWDVENRIEDRYCTCKQGFYECGTKCKPCVPPCKICTSEINCIDCNNAISGTYYYEDNCKPCNYPCQTCHDEILCITCGYGTEFRDINGGICSCKIGYYESGFECIQCVSPCIKCTSPTTCQDCDHYNSGFYLDTILLKCVACSYPCLKCSALDYCLECGWDVDNRVSAEIDPKCNCKAGLFQWGIVCLACQAPCLNCIDTAINCLSCIEGTYLENGQCKFCLYPCLTCKGQNKCLTCGWGTEKRKKPKELYSYYYQYEKIIVYDDQRCLCLNGYYNQDRDCLPCKLPCLTCSSKHQCITFDCKNQMSKTYYDTTAKACLPCPYPCITCSNNKKCLTCGYGIERRKSTYYQCACADTYYNYEQDCLPCQLPCINCSSLTVCITVNYQETISRQFYNSYTKQVEFCQYPCLTCINQANYCLACGYDTENRNNPPSCNCKSKFYEDGQVCRPCVLPCVTCTSETTCTSVTCSTHNGVVTSKYRLNNKQCKPCNFPCLTCMDNNPNRCTSCGYGADKRQLKQYINSYLGYIYDCRCKFGYYLKGIDCLPCAYPCKSCKTQEICLSSENCNYTTSGLYYKYNKCLPCTYPCRTCNYGSGAGYCHTCGYDSNRRQSITYKKTYHNSYIQQDYLYNYDRSCKCLNGYYEEDQQCKICVLPCITCTSLTVCITIFDCDFETSGLYRNGIQCQKCIYPCKLCKSATQCLTCGWDVQNRYDYNQNCKCLPKFYHDAIKQSCFQCVLPCLTCISEIECITIYDCDKETSGYYPSNSICKPCEYPCLTCNSKNNCITCGFQPDQRNPAPYCSCKEQFFTKNNSCIPCFLPCITCTSETNCLTTYDCDNETSGMYSQNRICKLCLYPCLTCTNATTCLTCKGNLDNRAEAPTCKCLDEFYNRGEECVKCELPCIKCTSATNCITRYDCDFNSSMTYRSGNNCYQCPYPCINCSSASVCINCQYEITNRYDPATNAICKCKDGYYEDGNDVCKSCILPCIKCTGPNYNQCKTIQACMPGEYRGSKYKCTPCLYPCLTCLSSTVCTSCGYEVQTRDYNKNCTCKYGFYHIEELKKCFLCIYPCIRCYSSTNCITYNDCAYTVSGMYYSNSQCKQCEYPCLTCLQNSTNCYTCGYGGPSVRIHPYYLKIRKYNYYQGVYYINEWYRDCSCKQGYYEDNLECKPCVLPCIQCYSLFECKTQDCKNNVTGQYWNNDEKMCKDCIYPCLTCYSEINCIQCYSEPETRQPNQCNCLDGYYEQNQQCLKCSLPCQTCSSEKVCITLNCQNEKTGQYIFTPDNYGEWIPENCNNLTLIEQMNINCYQVNQECKSCVYPCRTCTTATNCLDCGYSPEHRQGSNCLCSLNSYFDIQNQVCIANGCNYPCLSCQLGADSCTSCVDGMFLIGNMCNQCRDPEKCQRCSSLNTCISCTDQYYLESGNCLPCTYPCITCKTKTICLTCGTDYVFRNKPPLCTCLADFIDNGKQACIKCIKPCDKCFDTNLESCINCIDGYYLKINQCIQCPNSCKTCQDTSLCFRCQFGYYLLGVMCLPCNHPCGSCIDDKQCLTCINDNNKRLKPPSCSCNDINNNYYDNGKNCKICENPKKFCNIAGLPTDCISGYYLNKDGQQIQFFIEQNGGTDKQLKETCDCGEAECFLEDGVTACDENNSYLYGVIEQHDNAECILCMEGALTCTAIDNVIDCIDGYYKDGTICVKCVTPCTKCRDATYCYECGYDPTNLRIRPPTCRCDELYSDHGDKCDTCTAPCKTCTGFGLDQCLSCNDYYYLDSTTCEPCHDSCFQCNGPEDTDCILTSQLKCRDGYFPEDNLCKACVYPCETCSNLTFCYTCGYDVDNRYDVPDCRCRDEFSDDGTQCIQCTGNCRTCTGTGIDECINCLKGSYLVDTTCEVCDPSCTSCSTSSTVCQSCADNWYLSGEECLACVYPCITCYQADKCYTCGFTPERRYAPPGCNCMFEYTEYNENCLECHENCLKCTVEASENDCVSCAEGRYLDGTTCPECEIGCKSCSEAGKCINCKEGYYMEEDGFTCTACSPPCLTCFSATFCYTCGYMAEKRVNPPTCECKIDYVSIGLEICGTCQFNCATCVALGEFDCLSCVDGFYLNTDSEAPTNCLPCTPPCLNCGATPETCTICIDGYYFKDDGDGSSCKQCVYPCQTCSSPVLCIECGYVPSDRTNPPQCACKNGLADTGAGCGQCDDTCLQCNGINANNCLSCYEGTYLLEVTDSELATCEPCGEGCISCVTASNICQSCKIKYYQDGTNCIACSYPCDTCYSDTNCITCIDDFQENGISKRLNPPTCACKIDTYSYNTTKSTCIICAGNCKTCNTISPTDCITCNHGYYIDGTECKACQDGCKQCDPTDSSICTECYDRYFITAHKTVGGKKTCEQCQVPCEFCMGTSTQCITCGYCPELRITPPTCAFKDSYVGTVTDDTDGTKAGCFSCVHPCKQCLGNRDNDCLRCNFEFVHDPDTLSCVPCNPGSNCETCLLSDKASCITCLETFYLSGTECLPCVYPCITCLTADYCHECGFDDEEGTLDADGNIVPAPTRRTGIPSCACLDEYSDNGERCVLCTSPCLTCMTESTNDCLTCIIGTFHTIISNSLGTCDTCPEQCTHCTSLNNCQECAPNFYLDEESCVPCIYPCETCLTATFCYTCGYDLENKNSPPDCGCKPEFSDSLDGGLGCVICIGNCKTCMTAAVDDCTSCNEDFYLVGTECLPCHPGCNVCGDDTDSNCTECNDGYYLDGTTCVICKHPCLNCLTDTRCLSCKPGVERGLPPDCHCNDTFYDDGTNDDCLDCPTPGGICFNNDPNVFITCEDGYYMKEQDCIQCPTKCSTCYNDVFCYECFSTENRNAAPTCYCQTGFYENGNICTICPFPSLVCTSATDHQVCEDTYFVDIDREAGTSTCTKCSYPCIKCLVDFTCESCAPDISLRNPIPQCTCLNGYYDEKDENKILTKICKQCPDPSIQCLSATEFLSCLDTYYHNASTNECLPCVYPCLHCVSISFCTLCGFDIVNRDDPPTCFCQFGDFYQKNPQDKHCTKCSEDSENCIKCKSYNECLSCKDGFTLDGNFCAPCQSPCITCIGPICLTCGLAEEGSNAPTCDCLNETTDSGTYRICYDDTKQECQPKPCISPCENCKNETECVTCLPGDFRKDAPNCSCIDGFREDSRFKCVVPCDVGKYAIRDQCYDCEYPCSECDSEANYCIECNLGYKLAGGGKCDVSCVYPCQDCFLDDPFTCKSKCSGLNRDINTNCKCMDGYYSQEKLCLPCLHPCKHCQDNYTCTLCVDDGQARNLVIDGGNCECQLGYKTYLNICLEICQPGYYQYYDSCQQCHPQCLTCEGSGSNCLECNQGYYVKGLTCIRCPIICKNCETNSNGDQICTECSEATGRLQSLNDNCQCKEGYFERGTEDCGICQQPCQTCVQTRIQCLTCIEDGKNREPIPDCNCLQNFFAYQSTCLQCNHTCKTCQTEAQLCLSCYGTGLHRTTNLPYCECEDGWFDDGENDCKQCKYPCITCVSAKNNCLTCIFELEDRNPVPSCECIDGQYAEVDHHCHVCFWKCNTCINQNNYCLTCADQNRLAPQCDCDEGWFGLDPQPICNKCYKYCKTCEFIPENCLTCFDNINRQEIPSCQCLIGYYQDENDKICKSCVYPCQECSDIQTCINCSQVLDLNRKELIDNCQCKEGFYSNKIDKCEQCQDFCKECSEEDWKCTLCHDSIQDVQNKCQCPVTQYFDKTIKKCQKCVSPCFTCSSKYICLECQESSNRQLINDQCICINQYFENQLQNNQCEKCHISCNNCKKDPNNCQQCAQGFFQEYFDKNLEILNCSSCGLYGASVCTRSFETGLIMANQCLAGYYKQQDQQNPSIFYCQPDCKYIYNSNCLTCDYQKCLSCDQTQQFFQICEDDNLDCQTQDNCKQCEVEFCEKCSQDYKVCQQCINSYILNSKDQTCDKEILNTVQILNYCNPQSIEMQPLNCKTCDHIKRVCKSCYIDQNRALNNGQCECDIFFKETDQGTCETDDQHMISQDLISNLKQFKIHIIIGIIVSGFISNPTFLIHLLDTCQMIKYTLYLQIDFPTIIYEYFELLTMYEFEYLPQIVPLNQNLMTSPKGFQKNNVDGFLLRNLSPYILLLIGFSTIYILLLIIQKIFFKNNKKKGEKESKVKKFLQSLIYKIETDVYITGILQSYLTTVIACLLQLQVLYIQTNISILAKVISFIFLIIEISIPFLIINGANIYIINKRKNQQFKNKKNYLSVYQIVLFKQFTQKKKNNVINTGYFSIICFRKIFFGTTLALLNNQTTITISIFIFLNIFMIIYSLKCNPFYKIKRLRFLDAITESLYIGIYVSAFLFYKGNSEDKEQRYNVAYALIICASLIQFLEILNFIVEIFLIMILGIIKKCKKKKDKQKKKKKNKNQIYNLDDNQQQQQYKNIIKGQNYKQNEIQIETQDQIQQNEKMQNQQVLQIQLKEQKQIINSQSNIKTINNSDDTLIVQNPKNNLLNKIHSLNIQMYDDQDDNNIDRYQLSNGQLQVKQSSLEKIVNSSGDINTSPQQIQKIQKNKIKKENQQQEIGKLPQINSFTVGSIDVSSFNDNLKKNLQKIENQRKIELFKNIENAEKKKKKKRKINKKNEKIINVLQEQQLKKED